MIKAARKDFDIHKIAESGQCFRFFPNGENAFVLVAFSRILHIAMQEDAVCLDCTEKEFSELWETYFDLSRDYADIRRAVAPEDAFLRAAVQYGEGMRILAQDPWETLISFIISQRKSIPAIKGAIELLCKSCGETLRDGESVFYAFPTAEKVAALSMEELRACALGYRAKYVQGAATMVAEGKIDLDALRTYDDDALLQTLLTIPGVGSKVANCVMLFAYHRLSGFPRDVWINRIIEEEYGGAFPLSRYKGFEGVIQQYMFYYGRSRARGITETA